MSLSEEMLSDFVVASRSRSSSLSQHATLKQNKKKTIVFRFYYTYHNSFDIEIDEVAVNSFMITMIVSMKVDE